MSVKIGCVSINGVLGIEFSERIEVQIRARCLRKVAQRTCCLGIVKVLQHVHANHQVEWMWWRPRCNVALLVTVGGTCMFTYVN